MTLPSQYREAPRVSLTHLVTAILCAACASPTGPVATLRVQTDTSEYALGAPVMFTAVNQGNVTLFLASCGERVMVAIDRWQDDQWRQYSGDACLAIYPMLPQPLEAGAAYRSSGAFREVGRFRLRLGVGDGTAPPEWSGVSNAFDIR